MLPHPDQAIVDPAKVRDCLFSPSHPVGRFEARVFFAHGYTQENWEVLRADLLALAGTNDALPGQRGPYGTKYEVSGILRGPSGRDAVFTTVWMVPVGEDIPEFVTAYPG